MPDKASKAELKLKKPDSIINGNYHERDQLTPRASDNEAEVRQYGRRTMSLCIGGPVLMTNEVRKSVNHKINQELSTQFQQIIKK